MKLISFNQVSNIVEIDLDYGSYDLTVKAEINQKLVGKAEYLGGRMVTQPCYSLGIHILEESFYDKEGDELKQIMTEEHFINIRGVLLEKFEELEEEPEN